MDWLDLTIHYLGVATLTVILMAILAAVLLIVAFFVIRYTPRLHVGRPRNDGELCFYDPRIIVTGKGGERIEGGRQLITDPLKIKWWVGLSRRNSNKWFFGYIRWEPKES